jgi:hypothetical protein
METRFLRVFMMITISLTSVQTWAPIRLGGVENAAHPSSAVVFELSPISDSRTEP